MVFDSDVTNEIEQQNSLSKEIAAEVAQFFAAAKRAQSPWTAVKDDQGKTYYWNKDTNQTSWDKPAGFEEPPTPKRAPPPLADSPEVENEKLVQRSLEEQIREETLHWMKLATKVKPLCAADCDFFVFSWPHRYLVVVVCYSRTLVSAFCFPPCFEKIKQRTQ